MEVAMRAEVEIEAAVARLGVVELVVRDVVVEMMGCWRVCVRVGNRIMIARPWRRAWRRRWTEVCSGMGQLFRRC